MKNKRHAEAFEWFSHSSGTSLRLKSNQMKCDVLKYLSYNVHEIGWQTWRIPKRWLIFSDV